MDEGPERAVAPLRSRNFLVCKFSTDSILLNTFDYKTSKELQTAGGGQFQHRAGLTDLIKV